MVVHEIFGVNDDIRDITDEFARRGFHAVAPDLLRPRQQGALPGHRRALAVGWRGSGDRRRRRRGRWLAEQPGCTGEIGIAGSAFGGGFAIVMANRGFGASAVQYGRLPKNLDAALQGSCAMVASLRRSRDGTLPASPTSCVTGSSARGRRARREGEYAEAGHSFANHSSETAPRWLKPLTGSMNAGLSTPRPPTRGTDHPPVRRRAALSRRSGVDGMPWNVSGPRRTHPIPEA